MEDVKDTVHAVAEGLSERKADKQFDVRLRAIEKNISQVDRRIEALGKRFPRSRGPRFPFGLLLIAGFGYALYNPKTRAQLLGYLGNVSPAARDAVEGVIGKSQDAAADLRGGRGVGDSVQNAAQKVSQGTRDAVQDLGNDLNPPADRAARQAGSAIDQAADKLKDMSREAGRSVDRLADRAEDKANDLKH